jgi:hypothetical protein
MGNRLAGSMDVLGGGSTAGFGMPVSRQQGRSRTVFAAARLGPAGRLVCFTHLTSMADQPAELEGHDRGF